MSDSINNIDSLRSQETERLNNSFDTLKKILPEYRSRIFTSFIDTSEYDVQIVNELWSIKESIKPFGIFKEGHSFITIIKVNILEMKKTGTKSGYIRFQDTQNTIREILYEWWYDYEIREDNRMKIFDNPRETEAYKAIRNALQKFVDENKKQWVEITFHESWTPGNFINIIFSLSEEFLSNKRAPEIITGVPEIESENYKIDKNLSVEEKLKNWWTKEKDSSGIIYLQKDLSPEQQYKDNKAYVREYLEWVDKEYIWEQKFNREAVKKLWLVNKLPKNFKEFKKIRWNNHQNFVNEYFSKNNKPLLSGYWNRGGKWFFHIGDKEHCWLSNGRSVEINKKNITYYGNNHCFGYSLRLVKGR